MRITPARKPCLGLLCCAFPAIFLSEHVACNLLLALLAACCFAAAVIARPRTLALALLVFTVFLARHEIDWRRNPGRLPLQLLSQGHSLVHVTGIVTSDPVSAGYAYHLTHSRFEIRVTGVTYNSRSLATGFSSEVYWTGPPPDWGDEIAFDASISPIAPPRNPGEFDLANYLAHKGIFAQLSCDYPEDSQILARGKGGFLMTWARASRQWLERRLTLGIDDSPEAAGLVQTITLGQKQEISTDDRELFQHVGALHLFVVNGLHIALLATILQFLLKPFRIHRRTFALIIIPVLFAYALLTGLNPGSVRAAIMAAVMFGASFVERRSFSLNTLAAAALILLLWDTNDLFNTGFEYSFGVVAAIILLAGFVQNLILPLGLPDPYLPRTLWNQFQQGQEWLWRKVAGLAGVSIAASIGSFPFSATYFNLVTPSGFLANLLLVPIAFCILAEAIFSLLAAGLDSIAVLFNNVNWACAKTMLGLVHLFAMLPGGHFFVSTSPGLPECRITVLDLYSSQAAVIESGHSVWLVDCGNASSYFHTVRPFLQSCGVNHLDGLILTHGAAASIGAAQNVIADFAPRMLIEANTRDRSPARRAIRNSGYSITTVASGDPIPMGGAATCTVLFPPANFQASAAADKSLVLRIDCGKTGVLLMSESAFTGARWLLEHRKTLRASIVVFGGRSADLEGTDGFIAAVHPFAVIRGSPAYAAPAGEAHQWAAGALRLHATPFLQADTGAVTIDLAQSGSTLTGFMDGRKLTR
ncbi:MAG TPA: ComEC/Rec2 family competence protein [Chthoniobacteraceae bacterium]|nr:ComEC/Rec2 family competence protein [Chthoniobacteraceae bacterium]